MQEAACCSAASEGAGRQADCICISHPNSRLAALHKGGDMVTLPLFLSFPPPYTYIQTDNHTQSNQIQRREKAQLLNSALSRFIILSLSLSPISSYLTSCLFNPLTILFLYRLLLCLHLLRGQLYNKALPQCALPCAWRLRPAKTLKIWTQWTSSLPHRSQSLKIPATASTAIHTPAPCLYPSSIACSS